MKHKPPVCFCPDCYEEWARTEIERLEAVNEQLEADLDRWKTRAVHAERIVRDISILDGG